MMHSNLSHYVLRQILHGQPITHSRLQQCASLRVLRSFHRVQSRPRTEMRSISWFSKSKPDNAKLSKENMAESGSQILNQQQTHLRLGWQPLPREKVLVAFQRFFQAKVKMQSPVLDTQIEAALACFKFLEETKSQEAGIGLSYDDLEQSLKALALHNGKEKPEVYVELASELFNEISSRRGEFLALPQYQNRNETFEKRTIIPYIKILSNCDQGPMARTMLEQLLQKEPSNLRDNLFWRPIVAAFARRGQEDEIDQTIERMLACGSVFDRLVHQSILLAFAEVDDMPRIKKWFPRPIEDGKPPTAVTIISVLNACIAKREFEWGHQARDALLAQNPGKAGWDMAFRWAAALGKGVDEIERMMSVMERRSKENGSNLQPDIATINGLISDANFRKDSYNAERLLSLAQKLDIRPDARTYLLQMEHRLNAGDFDGARAAHKHLQATDATGDEDVPILNSLILGLCEAKTVDVETVMELVQELIERKAEFMPKTVAALCVLHLEREEFYLAIELLRTHTSGFKMTDRKLILEALVNVIHDENTSTDIAWDTYCILRGTFEELDRPARVEIMKKFFAKGEYDKAIQVFGNMRQQSVPEKRPAADDYAECFKGIGQCGNAKSFGIVYNMLKLDWEVEPDTNLNSALMLASLECKDPSRAIKFWEDIVYSREGPTYESICVALRACSLTADGKPYARDIWERLQRLDVEVTKEMCDWYITALVAHRALEDAISVFQVMGRSYGHEPDVVTLAMLCNRAYSKQGKLWAKAEDWARSSYPSLWEELEEGGKTLSGHFMLGFHTIQGWEVNEDGTLKEVTKHPIKAKREAERATAA